MQTVTKAEAERDFAAVFNAAAKAPVRIVEEGRDVVVVSATEFEEAQELLRRERGKRLIETMRLASEEARANGFSDDMLPELLKKD